MPKSTLVTRSLLPGTPKIGGTDSKNDNLRRIIRNQVNTAVMEYS